MVASSPGPIVEEPESRQIGPYRLLELLGEGGMGRVYRARHIVSGELVALKTVRQLDAGRTLALRIEIAGLRALSHPGVVRILEEGYQNGPWYSMELLDGATLSAYNHSLAGQTLGTRSSTLPASDVFERSEDRAPQLSSAARDSERAPMTRANVHETLRVYHSLCEPLAYIHARGIVHGDLKPANVFIHTEGRAVLMDFGLMAYARGALGREVLDPGERAMGTVYYLAPERIEGRLVDARADLYALGCMLYESLCGRPPYLGTSHQILSQHITSRPVRPSELVPEIPPDIEELILAMLAKSAQARIGHATEVAAGIRAALGEPPSAPATAMVPLYRPELSGRHELLDRMDECLRNAAAGRGSLVFLGGESGIGKTFLASEVAFRAGRAGFRVVTGDAIPVSAIESGMPGVSAGPLHPMRRWLQSVADACQESAGARERILGGRVQYLAPYEPTLTALRGEGDSTPATLPAAGARERVIKALLETLAAFVARSPLLLVLDDLQWADELTLAFLRGLDASFFETHPLVLLGTYRSDEASDAVKDIVRSASAVNLHLPRLAHGAIAKMVGDMLAMDNPPAHLVEFLVRESEGNPFFVAEYLRYLVHEKYLKRFQGGWEATQASSLVHTGRDSVPGPSSLRELVLRRLTALRPNAQQAIRAAAVLGRTFQFQMLSTVSRMPEPELLSAIGEARESHVVEPSDPGCFRFVHDKLRESAYGMIPTEALAELHARAAAGIEAGLAAGSAADLARHYRLARNPAKALEYLDKAGADAIAKSSHKEAANLLKHAIQIADQIGGVEPLRRARWQRQIADALQADGDFSASIPHLERALIVLRQPMPSSLLGLLINLTFNVAQQTAHRLLSSWLLHSRNARSDILLESARAYDRLQQAFYYRGDAMPMLYTCLKTLNLTESSSRSPDLTVAYATAHAVAGLMPLGWLAKTFYRRAKENALAVPDPVAESYFLLLSGNHLVGSGNWEEAISTLERGRAMAERLNFGRRMRELTGALGVACSLRGDFERARQCAQLLDRYAHESDVQIRCWAHLSRAQISSLLGDHTATLHEISAARPLVAMLGRPERIWSNSLEAAALWARKDLQSADALSLSALRDICASPPVSWYNMDAYRACAEIRVGLVSRSSQFASYTSDLFRRHAEQACRALRKLARVFPVAQPRCSLIEGLRRLALNRDEKAAASCWRMSLAAAENLHMDYDAARAHLALASISEPGPERDAHARTGTALLLALGADPTAIAEFTLGAVVATGPA